MGARCSCLTARSVGRALTLCGHRSPRVPPGSQAKQDCTRNNAPVLGIVPLDNPPDVIGAHERYFRRDLSQPVKYSYFSPPLRDDRTLPTQHQHPTAPRTAPGTGRVAPPKPERTSLPAGANSKPPHHALSGTPPRSHRRHHRHRTRTRSSKSRHESRTGSRSSRGKERGCFGYDIQDVDGFLAKASLAKPANIPMVLGCASTLYRTREGGWQDEVSLPLGMVVNGVFRVSCWLYAQTPHGHGGYVRYSSCLPLGILPLPPRAPRHSRPTAPCWDTASDIFPALCGNQTDSDKLKDTRSERAYGSTQSLSVLRAPRRRLTRLALQEARRAEQSVDALYLRASSRPSSPTSVTSGQQGRGRSQPLVVVHREFHSAGLSLVQGDVLAVLDAPSRGWLRVRDHHGREDLVPADIIDSGFI